MLQLKLAHASDLAKIVATYNSSIPSKRSTADLMEVSVESKRGWFNEHDESKRPIWLVFFRDNYAGWLSFSDFYKRPAYHATAELSLYLETDFQGKGIGSQVLVLAEEEAIKRNITTLLGFIFGHNIASLKLFEKTGYKVWGTLPQIANMSGVLRDLLILGKKLTPPHEASLI